MSIRNYIDLVELAPFKNDEKIKAFNDASAIAYNDQDTLERFSRFMQERGFTKLGAGRYASVFSHPSLDYVIKVFISDSGYKKFFDYCMAHPNNPHLPKFRGKLMTLDKINYLVRMERLRPVNTDEEWSAAQIINDFTEGKVSAQKFFNARDHYEASAPSGMKLIDSQPGFMETIFNLAHVKKYFDLHSDNIMVRPSDNILVITDPFNGF